MAWCATHDEQRGAWLVRSSFFPSRRRPGDVAKRCAECMRRLRVVANGERVQEDFPKVTEETGRGEIVGDRKALKSMDIKAEDVREHVGAERWQAIINKAASRAAEGDMMAFKLLAEMMGVAKIGEQLDDQGMTIRSYFVDDPGAVTDTL